MFDNSLFRKLVLLAVLAAAWEAYARWLANPLLFPTFSATVVALVSSIARSEFNCDKALSKSPVTTL